MFLAMHISNCPFTHSGRAAIAQGQALEEYYWSQAAQYPKKASHVREGPSIERLRNRILLQRLMDVCRPSSFSASDCKTDILQFAGAISCGYQDNKLRAEAALQLMKTVNVMSHARASILIPSKTCMPPVQGREGDDKCGLMSGSIE